jgi:hypothetical protein
MPLANTSLIHPRFFENLETTFWRHTCTIQEATQTANEVGEPARTWADLVGHTHISCNLAAKESMSEQTSEQRRDDSTYDAKTRHLQLNGHYPLITGGMRAVVDATAYDIRGVVHSSAKVQTKLIVELIT